MLDLTMQITADASQAKAELRSVEQGIQRVEGASNKTAPAITKVTDAVAGQGRELSNVEQAFVKAEAATLSAERAASRLGSTSSATTQALGGLTGGSTDAASALLGMVGAGGLSVAMLSGIAAAAGLALGAAAALAGVIVSSTQYYVEHAKEARGLRAEIDHLTDTWNTFQMIVGASVIGGAETPLISFLRLGEEWAIKFGLKLAGDILLLREMANSMLSLPSWASILTSTDTGALPLTPQQAMAALPPGFKNRFLPGYSWGGDMTAGPNAGSWFDPMHPPSGDQAMAEFEKQEAERIRREKEAARLAKQHADEYRRQQEAIKRAYESGPGYVLGISGHLGELVPKPKGPFDPSGMLDYKLGARGSMPEVASVKDMLAGVTFAPSYLSRLFGKGGLAPTIGNTLERFLVQRSDPGSAIGASVGGSIFGTLMGGETGKAISKALTGSFLGKTMGKAVGSFIPFGGEILGSLVGKLFGKLFGETQGHKDLMAGNKQIEDMKAALSAQYGSNAAAQNAGSMFGVDLKAAWNSQNLAGAEHFKALLGELAQKQAKFNDDLGGTISKIRDLGGSVDPALMPYLDRLKEAKVLTQDNLDLIANLTKDAVPTWEQMEAVAKKYNLTIEQLGPTFQAQKLHAGWQELIDDMDLLIRGGAELQTLLVNPAHDSEEVHVLQVKQQKLLAQINDMNKKGGPATEVQAHNMAVWKEQLAEINAELEHLGGVTLTGLGEKFQELVLQSLKFGIALPENMRPVAQALIDQGLLLDANGKKITDINQLTFGETMQTTLEKLNATLKELVEALGVKLPNAASEGARKTQEALDKIHVPKVTPDSGDGTDPNGGGDGPTDEPRAPFHYGGLIMHRGGLVPKRLHWGGLSADEIPIVAQRGEYMMQRSAVNYYGKGMMRAINQRQFAPSSGGHGGSMTLVLEQDGRTAARWIVPFIPGEVKRLGLFPR